MFTLASVHSLISTICPVVISIVPISVVPPVLCHAKKQLPLFTTTSNVVTYVFPIVGAIVVLVFTLGYVVLVPTVVTAKLKLLLVSDENVVTSSEFAIVGAVALSKSALN